MVNKLITGSFQMMKSLNRSVILNVIRKEKAISRADIAKITNLTPPTVSSLVKELLETEIIVERELGKSTGGRKPTILTLNSQMFHVIGLDVGSQHLKTILTDINGKIHKKEVLKIPNNLTNEILLSLMIKAVYSIIDSKDVNKKKIVGIGVAMHGIVDVDNGISIFAPNLNLRNIPIREVLEKEFNLTVQIENDARAMCLGELWFGQGSDVDNLVCINIGRGIGAGMIINRKVYRGHSYISGEIGHMTIDMNGPRCSCGNDGCLQTFASGPAIVELIKKEIHNGAKSSLTEQFEKGLEGVTGEDIHHEAVKGDPLSQHILKQAGQYLGIGLTNLIHTMNPNRIIIGGGVANAGNYLFKPLLETIQQRALTLSAKHTEILPSKFGDDATVIGAVTLILTELFSTGENG